MARTTCPVKRRFSLIEMMIVVSILALLTLIAMMYFGSLRRQARDVRFVADVRTASGAFIMHNMERGYWSPDRNPGQIPPGMEDYLGRFPWKDETPFGGQWDWDRGVFGFTAGVSVYRPNRGAAEMVSVDRLLDDGDLTTGVFQARTDGYIYVLEE